MLRTGVLEVAVVPDLGAKVVSLRNCVSGREWMWHPPGPLRLFRNFPGDDFAAGTLVGWDECLPTVAPCVWKGRDLPDHGEVWAVPWTVDESAWHRGEVSTSLDLPVSPLRFERTIRASGATVYAGYRLTNKTGDRMEYHWAMHPLLAIEDGDRVELPDEARGAARAAGWPDDPDFGGRRPAAAKVYTPPLRIGRASVRNSRTGDGLVLEWDPAENGTLGLWLTRGGWHGYHHLALEPTCGSDDSLAACVRGGGRFGQLAGGGTNEWSVTIRVEPASPTTARYAGGGST